MVYISQAFKPLVIIVLLSQSTIAHPGHDLAQEIAERNAFYLNSPRDLTHCNDLLRKRGMEDKQRKRRQAAIEKARAERGLPQKRQVIDRDLESATNTSHHSSLDVTPTTPGVEEIIYSNSSCLLFPEGEIGPFYVLGEYVRKNITETQAGVPVIVDAQFINIETCQPIPNLMWDIWHCNSTGVYGGVISGGNGDSADTSNLNNTFLRGMQPSDSDGVAQFDSIFPGHYAGRCTHMHVISPLNGTILENGTYSGGNIAHIGQVFFDQDLISQVESLSPYNQNTIAVTENVNDRVVQAEVANNADPFLNYVLLGDDVSDGLFCGLHWASISLLHMHIRRLQNLPLVEVLPLVAVGALVVVSMVPEGSMEHAGWLFWIPGRDPDKHRCPMRQFVNYKWYWEKLLIFARMSVEICPWMWNSHLEYESDTIRFWNEI